MKKINPEIWIACLSAVAFIALFSFGIRDCVGNINENSYRRKWLACECKDASSKELCKDILRNEK